MHSRGTTSTLKGGSLSSPPPHYNFKEIPEVHHGPHEFSNPVVMEQLGRDWIAQSEPMPEAAAAAKSG